MVAYILIGFVVGLFTMTIMGLYRWTIGKLSG